MTWAGADARLCEKGPNSKTMKSGGMAEIRMRIVGYEPLCKTARHSEFQISVLHVAENHSSEVRLQVLLYHVEGVIPCQRCTRAAVVVRKKKDQTYLLLLAQSEGDIFIERHKNRKIRELDLGGEFLDLAGLKGTDFARRQAGCQERFCP